MSSQDATIPMTGVVVERLREAGGAMVAGVEQLVQQFERVPSDRGSEASGPPRAKQRTDSGL
eukprot:3150221-Prorocentrum_lima.AAC.1